MSPKIGCNLNLREQMSFTEQCIRHQLLKYVKPRYQCLTLHPTPPVPMFTMSNQDSDSKEPFKHPKVGFCSLTWYSENVQSSSQMSIFWNWALCPRPVRLSDCRLRSCKPETERFHSNVQRRVCRQAWDRRRRFRLYLDETHRWNYSWRKRQINI